MLIKINYILILFFLLSSIKAKVVARIIKIEGRVNVKRLGTEYFDENAKVGLSIVNGDAIKVGDNGFCAVMYVNDKSIIKIRENSKFGFIDTENTRTIDLKYGTLLNDVKSKGRSKSFRIQTPVSVASVKGTKFAAISSQSGVDQFIGKEGFFEVLNMISGQTVSVKAGQKAISNTSGDIVQTPAFPDDYPNDPEVEEYKLPEIKTVEEIKQDNILDSNSETDTGIENNEQIQKKELNEELEISEKIDNIEELEEIENNKKTDQEGPPPKPFGMGLGIGSATLDGSLYNQLSLRPEINIGKIGIGIDLIFYIDNEGNFKDIGWDIENDPSLLMDKILYVKYGNKSDPFWAKYGSIEGLTLGYGGLMNSYSNMMEFPTVRKVGVNTGFNFGPVGGEVFLSNVKDFFVRDGTITGFRFAYRISDKIPLVFGVNYVMDINMFSGLIDKDEDTFPDIFDDFPNDITLWNDSDGDGIPDPHPELDTLLWDIDSDGDNIYDFGQNGDTLINLKARPFSLKNNKAQTSGLSFDIGYPLFKSKAISFMIYAEYNTLKFPAVSTVDSSFIRLKRSGSGLTIPGIRSTIFNILNLSLEYRIISGSYIPQFFDQAYDLNRVITSTAKDGNTIINTKDMSIFEDYNDSTSSSGLFGSVGLSLFNLVNFSVTYANMKADTSELKSFSSILNLNTDNIPKVSSAMAYYQRNNDVNPFDIDNPSKNTIMGYRIGYEMSKGVSLIWDFRQYYRDDGTGKVEPIKQTNIETSFNF